ncbi:hypothetical protein Tco_0221738 [Tanacetum coccineum]
MELELSEYHVYCQCGVDGMEGGRKTCGDVKVSLMLGFGKFDWGDCFLEMVHDEEDVFIGEDDCDEDE